jgi:hypothetical protein
MMHIDAEVADSQGVIERRSIFLRGDCVDVLATLHCEGQEYVVFVSQTRAAGGQRVISNPSGMLDGQWADVAALRELDEELDMHLPWSDPVSLGFYALGTHQPMLTSPGGTDERVHFMHVSTSVTLDQLNELNSRHGGSVAEGERTQVHVVPRPLAILYLKTNSRSVDVKTVLSLYLYDAWCNRPRPR